MSFKINKAEKNQSYHSVQPIEQHQFPSNHVLRQTVSHNSRSKNNLQPKLSLCLNNKNEINELLETINRYEMEIMEKQRFYSKAVAEFTKKIGEKAEQNQMIKKEIIQLKGQSRKIRKEVECFADSGSIKLQKSLSSRDIISGIKRQNNLDNCKSATNILRMTLPNNYKNFDLNFNQN